MLTRRTAYIGVLIFAAFLAGCTQQGTTGIGGGGPGVVVSCDSTSIEGFSIDTDPSGGESSCEAFIRVTPINREPICTGYAPIDGSGTVPCPELSQFNNTVQMTIEADFYEPQTTNQIGSDTAREDWDPEN